MQISVIIVSYNVRAFLENCLVSVQKALEHLASEIIVVDNASDDGSVEMIQQKFPHVQLIINETNLGFGKANNQAGKNASGEFLFMLNPDTVVQENTFNVMLDFFQQHPDAGIAGCKVLNSDGTLQPACRRSFPTPWVAFTKITGLSSLAPNSPLFSKYNLTYFNPDETYEVDAVSGSCMMIRTPDFVQLGGFDEQFFMYGEDLDLCYRVQHTGKKVYYVHETQIIHYKGESVRRSDINDVRVFYQAMRLFVQKHFRFGTAANLILGFGIALREWIALIGKHATMFRSMLFDYVLVIISWLGGEWIRFGELMYFPSYAYPVLLIIPPLVTLGTMFLFDVYTARKHSFARTFNAILTANVLLAALTFFFNEYAFSRFVLFIAGAISCVLLTGWRAILRSRQHGEMFSKRTLIVGTNVSSIELISKLRGRNNHGYEIVGFVDTDRKRIGERIEGIEILGSIDTIGRVIQQHNISDVIFSNNSISYADVLSVISNSSDRTIHYRLVPSSLEVIIGKTHIDELNDLPLVDIEYNINRLPNRVVKRSMDVVIGFLLFVTLYPIACIRTGKNKGAFSNAFLNIPKVLSGEMSLVGISVQNNNRKEKKFKNIGKRGISGLAQVNNFDKLSPEEIAQYNLSYAKNQSFFLDIEIILKSIILFIWK
ncbi:MAG: glycosyltransferase [Ignavibacteriales bacterium]|nr:glycosyltransferase [Ignavibacteriales bacterium]